MPENETHVIPFRGLRYNTSKCCPLAEVVTPPFDAIDKPLQKRLYEQHPYNAVRLDLNLVTPDDSIQNNAYTRASEFFSTWQEKGILIPEEKPVIYTYQQQWTDENGKTIERKGIVLLLEVEPYETKRVLPHENTLIGPKSDRLNLLKMAQGNFSPIFMAYSDPKQTLEQNLFISNQATQAVTDEAGVIHSFTPVNDPQLIETVQQLIKSQQLLIADGHHRYETALAFMEDARERYRELTGKTALKGSLTSDYTMVYLANIENYGLKANPIHRLILQWPNGLSQEVFKERLLQTFNIVESGEDFTYLSHKTPSLPLKLKSKEQLAGLATALHQVDTAILEHVVFKGIFNATTVELKTSRSLGFATELTQVEKQLVNGEAETAFLMKTPDLSLIKDACAQGLRMPLKSTFFCPKLLTGLVFYSYSAFKCQEEPQNELNDDISKQSPLPNKAFSVEKYGIDYRMALIPD